MRQATYNELTYLANHPRIAPAMGLQPDQLLDMTGIIEDKRNISFWCPLGAMIFGYEGPNVYDSHFLFIPGHSAKEIRQYAKAMLHEMFTKYGALVIKGRPPRDNRAVRILGIPLGYMKIPNSEFTDDFGRKCEIYQVRKEQWARH